jgi:hypothetical protein
MKTSCGKALEAFALIIFFVTGVLLKFEQVAGYAARGVIEVVRVLPTEISSAATEYVAAINLTYTNKGLSNEAFEFLDTLSDGDAVMFPNGAVVVIMEPISAIVSGSSLQEIYCDSSYYGRCDEQITDSRWNTFLTVTDISRSKSYIDRWSKSPSVASFRINEGDVVKVQPKCELTVVPRVKIPYACAGLSCTRAAYCRTALRCSGVISYYCKSQVARIHEGHYDVPINGVITGETGIQ